METRRQTSSDGPALKATAIIQPDRRMLVLVLIGLGICLPQLYNFLGRAPEYRNKPQNQSRIVWLETAAAQGSGLYWLDAPAETWQGSFAALGLYFPAAESPMSGGDFLLPAYRLQANVQPQAISPPAQAAPIFFQPIPINQSSFETLMVIPGIGRRLAATIIDYRDRAGGIDDLASLLAIDGIGEKKAAIIAGYVRFD